MWLALESLTTFSANQRLKKLRFAGIRHAWSAGEVFPRLAPVSCIRFAAWLVLSIFFVSYHWPSQGLFCSSRLQSALSVQNMCNLLLVVCVAVRPTCCSTSSSSWGLLLFIPCEKVLSILAGLCHRTTDHVMGKGKNGWRTRWMVRKLVNFSTTELFLAQDLSQDNHN